MTTSLFFSLLGLALFNLGLYTLFSRPRFLQKILALNVSGSGLFLLMVAMAHDPVHGKPDPILHALVLTGIVIAVSMTAYGLALAGRSGRNSHGSPS